MTLATGMHRICSCPCPSPPRPPSHHSPHGASACPHGPTPPRKHCRAPIKPSPRSRGRGVRNLPSPCHRPFGSTTVRDQACRVDLVEVSHDLRAREQDGRLRRAHISHTTWLKPGFRTTLFKPSSHNSGGPGLVCKPWPRMQWAALPSLPTHVYMHTRARAYNASSAWLHMI